MMLLLTFVIVMAARVIAGDCPMSCICSSYPRDPDKPDLFYTSLNCKPDLKFNFTFPENTETLIFENTTLDLENLIEDLLIIEKLPYFSKLILMGIVLPNLSNISVSGLDRLRQLQVSNCNVEYLPCFNLTSLQALDVSNNALKVIQNEQFRTLQVLEVLNLSVNALETVEPNGFVGLKSLKCLDLSRNNLSYLEDNVLVPLVTLQHLNLSNNKLEVLNEACFSSLLYLQQLDVSWNRLARVAPGCLELPSLARLLLAGNPQLGEPALFVGTGRRLQTVDASRTGLKQVPAALTHSIRTLRLAGNSIPSVNCGDLDSYPLLQLLDFTSNTLAEIEEDALGRLDSLRILYLTDNKLRSIPHSLPERLKVLHLEHNEIKSIQTADLQGLAQLEVLLLNGNHIQMVMEAAFSQLLSLVTLDLSHNPIGELPSGSLAGPTQLRVLKLAGLNVISPAKEVEFPLPTPEHLITLDLSISPGLARQMLADTAALAAARELQELNLVSAGLNYIRSDLLHFLPQLRVMHLRDNPLNCSGLQWLAEWMRRQDESENREVVCSAPPELWGTLLVDLQSIETETINHEKNNTLTTIPPRTTTIIKPSSMEDAKTTTLITTQVPVKTTTSPMKESNEIKSQPTNFEVTIEENVKHEITTKFIVGYPYASMKPMNIFAPWKSSPEKVNSVLKEPEAGPEGNLFMKKSLHNRESSTKDDNNNDLQVDIILGTSTELKENVTTGEMSMYSETRARNFAHPGMIVLAVGILAAAAVLITLTTRITRRTRSNQTHEDIEVSSLPSVTELW